MEGYPGGPSSVKAHVKPEAHLPLAKSLFRDKPKDSLSQAVEEGKMPSSQEVCMCKHLHPDQIHKPMCSWGFVGKAEVVCCHRKRSGQRLKS